MHFERMKVLRAYSESLKAMRAADETAEAKYLAIDRWQAALDILKDAEARYPTRSERQSKARSANLQPRESWRLWRA